MAGVVGCSPDLGQDGLGFHASSPRRDLLPVAQAAVGRLYGSHGIVRRCRQYPPVPGLPTCPIFVARGPKRGFGGWDPGFDVIGMGVSDDAQDARLKAIVEAVERYCFAWAHDPSVVHRRSYQEVGETAVPLESFRPYTDAQYAARPSMRFPKSDDPIDWTWAYSLTRECFALVPAVVVYGSIGFRPPNNFTRSSSSTGVACHVSVEAALLAGLLEVVERDAIMLFWLNRRSPKHIALEGDIALDVTRLLADHFDVPDFDFFLLDITGDSGIPTVCCRAAGLRPDRPSSAFGAACRLDPVAAARKALFESAQVLSGLYGLGCDAATSMEEHEVRDIWDHARFYAGAGSADRIEFMTASSDRTTLSDIAVCGTGDLGEDLRVCVQRLAGIGLEVLAVDLTPSDVGRCGFRTVKVIVPGMIDINGDARFPQLGPERVREVPKAMGWPALGDEGLNLAPCPMS